MLPNRKKGIDRQNNFLVCTDTRSWILGVIASCINSK